jgi:hypothetical protein
MLNFELRWAATASRCILPTGSLGGTTDDRDLFALYQADSAIAPWQANVVLRLSIWMTWFAPLWMEGRFKTFGGLSEAERVQLMEKLLVSKAHLVRLTMLYLKLMTTSLLMGNETTLAYLGAYDLVPGSKPARVPEPGNAPVQLGVRA